MTDWFDSHWAALAIALLAALCIAGLLYGVRALIRRRRVAADMTLTDILLHTLGRTRTPAILGFSIAVAAGFADLPLRVGGAFTLLLTAVITLQGAAWVRDIVLGLVQRQASRTGSETLTNSLAIIRVLISAALFAIAVVIVLDNVGVNVSALIAGLGIGGIAIGLAAQGIFADLFAALSIIFDRPFGKGDAIRYDNSFATVEKIGLQSTRLRSVNGELLIISNTNLLDKEIANFTGIAQRRVMLTVGVTYQTSPERLRALPALMERVVVETGQIFARASFTGFGASSLDFELVFDVASEDIVVVGAHRRRHRAVRGDGRRGLCLCLSDPDHFYRRARWHDDPAVARRRVGRPGQPDRHARQRLTLRRQGTGATGLHGARKARKTQLNAAG